MSQEQPVKKKRGRKKSKANYFTEDTDKAIVAYNNSTDPIFRAKIFTDQIYYPFYKLVENIIHTFKFYYTDVDTIEDLKHELISLLLEEKIHYFDPTRGAKAYSYFGTIIKRHLIVYNKQNYKALQQKAPTDGLENHEVYPTDIEDNQTKQLSEIVDVFADRCEGSLEELFPKEQDQRIADAILTLFRKRKTLELFNKKALYILIREMTGVETLNITKVVNILKDEFYEVYYEYAADYRITSKD